MNALYHTSRGEMVDVVRMCVYKEKLPERNNAVLVNVCTVGEKVNYKRMCCSVRAHFLHKKRCLFFNWTLSENRHQFWRAPPPRAGGDDGCPAMFDELDSIAQARCVTNETSTQQTARPKNIKATLKHDCQCNGPSTKVAYNPINQIDACNLLKCRRRRRRFTICI